MRVLVIGGSGYVGSLVLPLLAPHHHLRVFDLRPPLDTTLEYIEGDIGDQAALERATQNIDALLYLAMGRRPPREGDPWTAWETKTDAFDVNVKGVYLALFAAHQAGVAHAVYASSLSVYHAMDGRNRDVRYYTDEDLPPDARNLYGFTKRLGEEVCRNAVREWNLSVNALRLCLPTPREKWLAETKPGEPTIATTAEDVARALGAALAFRAGFQAFTISGDYEQKLMSLAKAKQFLGWEPQARPLNVQGVQ